MFFQFNTLSAFDFYHSTVSIEEYVKRAKLLSYNGVGVSDPNVYAFPSLAKECEKEGIKPLFGYRSHIQSSFSYHYEISLYLLNEEGYRNLCLLLSYKEETLSLSLLKRHCNGLALILHTGHDFYSETFLNYASKDILEMKNIFNDNFYIGISLVSSNDEVNVDTLYRYCDGYEYQTLAFPFVKYLLKTDAYKTAVLESSEHVKETEEESSIEEEGPFFLLSEKVIEKIYRQKDIQECEKLADKINFSFFEKRGQLISYDDEDTKLKEASLSGLKEKLNCDQIPEAYLTRLKYELEVIKTMKFSSYFLIVDDYVRFAKTNGIKVGPGRGSAGGSLVAYALDITDIDPIRFDLTFERFLNPNRVTMPDIDVDFDDERRNEVVLYLKQKYGEERVSPITTFVRLKPKSCLNLIGPVLKVQENRLKKLTSSISDKANTFEEARKDPYKGQAFSRLYQDPYFKKICDTANSLLGLPINTSLHAPGVILSQNPIYQSVPLSEGKKGAVLYEYPNMEQLGFLKVDILALSNLTFIKKIEEKILQNKKELPNISCDLENKAVYEVLNRLNLVEIFQLDSSFGMRKTIQAIKPSCFSDLAAAIALYRPGPMDHILDFASRKQGKEKIVYQDEKLKPILEETYGIMVYQEQIMKAVQVLASFTLGEADLFRRAISKKQASKMKEYKTAFLEGSMKNGLSKEKAESIYQNIEKFAEYGFNKSHAYAYGLIAYTLLYYKALYPKEFYLTALEKESLSSSKMSQIIEELQERKIVLRNPNINLSKPNEFVLKGNEIYLPLIASGNSDLFFKAIVEEREKGEFTSFYNFLFRLSSSIGEKDIKMMESFIDTGVFDCFSKNRAMLKKDMPDYLNFAHFDMLESSIPPLSKGEVDLGEMFYLEKMILGRILSCPLKKVFTRSSYHTLLVSDVSQMEFSHTITVEDEEKKYKIRFVKPSKVEKYDFVLVKGRLPYKANDYIEVEDFVECHRKVIKHA